MRRKSAKSRREQTVCRSSDAPAVYPAIKPRVEIVPGITLEV